jgi:hypothetical protein
VSRSGRWLAAVGAGLVLAAGSGCRGEREQALRGEAGTLVHAIRQLRDATNQGKRPQLKALAHLTCSAEDLCELQRVCRHAYERHQQALDATQTLRHALAEDAGADATTGANDLMSNARRDLERARFLARLCSDLEGKVTRRYGL